MKKTLHSFVLVIALAMAAAPAVDGAAARGKKEAAEKRPLPAEKEKALAELMKKLGDGKRKFWQERMNTEIERVTKAVPLDAEKTKVLTAAAAQAVEACVPGWVEMLEKGWRQFMSEQGQAQVEIEQVMSSADQTIAMDWYGDVTRPFEHEKWKEGLSQALNAEQFAAWDKSESDRIAAVKKEVEDFVKTAVDQACEQQKRSLGRKAASIKRTLGLSKEKADQLEALAENTSTQVAKEMRERIERTMLAVDDQQRRQMIATRQFFFGMEGDESKAQETAWKEGLAKLLTPEDSKKLESRDDGAVDKYAGVIGRILITQLDERVAFTVAQRERLEPIIGRVVKEQTKSLPEQNDEPFSRMDPAQFLAAATKAPEKEISAILDEKQWKRWEDFCSGNDDAARWGALGRSRKHAAAVEKAAVRAPEPEELENAFSDYFHERATNERKRLLAGHLLKAEDAARVAKLPPEAAARLETAARGATEDALAKWRTNIENSVRNGQLRDATPENIRQRLAGMGTVSYRNFDAGSPGPAIWAQAVKRELTADQQAAWKKEMDGRKKYRDEAIAALLLFQFDRKIPLRNEQLAQLEPKIIKAVTDYEPDIGRMFSSSSGYTWYSQSYSMFIPFAAVPEAEFKAILDESQWDGWQHSEEFSNTSNYWENVRRSHESRMKEVRK